MQRIGQNAGEGKSGIMKRIKDLGLDTFKNILYMEQEELHHYVLGRLEEYYDTADIYEVKGDYIYVKGTIPVLLCAHLDTVHKAKPTEETLFHDQEKNVMWCPNGIGGDDRCGVFNILDILSKGYLPYLIFSWDEEVGGIGASELVDTLDIYFGQDVWDNLRNGVNLAIQFDRHGFSEAVYYNLNSKEFEEYISSFGFETEWGTYTDICEYCPEFGFAGVNIAAGYTDEHTNQELIFINELYESQRKVIDILEDQIAEPKYFEYIDYGYASNSRYNYGYGYGENYYFDSPNEFDDEESLIGFNDEYKEGYGDHDYHNDEDVFCQYCMQSKAVVPWTESEDPVLNKLCDECKKVFKMERQ